MDEQRLEEIAKRSATATLDTVFHLPDTTARFRSILEESAYRAACEALSSQEEELRKVRSELADIATAVGHEPHMSKPVCAMVRSLKEQVTAAGKFADPEYRDAYISEANRDVLDACAAKQQAEDACERLALEVRSLREERDAAALTAQFDAGTIRALVDERATFKAAWEASADVAQKAVTDMGAERVKRKEAEARAEAAEADARLQKEIADAYAFERDTAEAEVKRLRERAGEP